ncbi:site-specific integrase [Knoellia sp. S7-12]|uniref:site-specific integrase n=1 Tax=Knoellia sp. S7-12 TaxID=3126698 RepID=UPI003366EEBE
MPERYRVAVLVAAFGALRAGEVFGLARRHLDLARGTIEIERALTYVPGTGRSFGSPKSSAGRRSIHLPRPVLDALELHVTEYVAPGPDALLFPTSRGTALHSSNRSAIFRRAAIAAGRPDLRFHDLRHTGATLAAQHGASLPDLMRRLGHSTARASLIYLHSTEAADKALASRLSEAFMTPAG